MQRCKILVAFLGIASASQCYLANLEADQPLNITPASIQLLHTQASWCHFPHHNILYSANILSCALRPSRLSPLTARFSSNNQNPPPQRHAVWQRNLKIKKTLGPDPVQAIHLGPHKADVAWLDVDSARLRVCGQDRADSVGNIRYCYGAEDCGWRDLRGGSWSWGGCWCRNSAVGGAVSGRGGCSFDRSFVE
jgi:hypothetical protein